MKKIKVMSVFGTRPEAIKMAPLVQTLAQRPEFESICCLTGQHREMLDSVMQIFRLTAQYDLNIMQKQQTLSSITTRALLGMEQALQEAQPDLVLVHGDTSTTFAGALAAFYHQVKVGHVEAGLRTWDKYSPFPEEMNRTLVGDIADLHFSPTKANAENLRREAVMGDVFITGNTAIDAMRYTVNQDFRFDINSYRKSQSHKHTTGIRFYRLVDKISDICKIQDILQFCIDLFFAESDHLTVQIHVFDTGILSVESGSQFQQRGDSSIHHHFSLCGIQYAGDNF